MRLSSGMEAWPQSRLGDNTVTVGNVTHIRPTVPTNSNTRSKVIKVGANNKNLGYNKPRK